MLFPSVDRRLLVSIQGGMKYEFLQYPVKDQQEDEVWVIKKRIEQD